MNWAFCAAYACSRAVLSSAICVKRSCTDAYPLPVGGGVGPLCGNTAGWYPISTAPCGSPPDGGDGTGPPPGTPAPPGTSPTPSPPPPGAPGTPGDGMFAADPGTPLA